MIKQYSVNTITHIICVSNPHLTAMMIPILTSPSMW